MAVGRCIILIDGSNFYHKLKELGLSQLLTFHFAQFVTFLAGNNTVVHATYYVGAVRSGTTEHAKRLFDKQQKLLGHLKKQGLGYSLGYLLKSGGVFHEKGVDVNIAVDMLVAAYEDQCDSIILVSSDTDLLPAIKKARQKGKEVVYVGFSHRPSVAMVAECSESRLLRKADLLPLIPIQAA